MINRQVVCYSGKLYLDGNEASDIADEAPNPLEEVPIGSSFRQTQRVRVWNGLSWLSFAEDGLPAWGAFSE